MFKTGVINNFILEGYISKYLPNKIIDIKIKALNGDCQFLS